MSEDDNDCLLMENINYKSISCEKIPELFLDKLIAKKHFSQFGRINKFILFPNRLSCTIDYEREEDAKNAVMKSGIFNGQNFPVKYTEMDNTQARNTEEWIDSDVQAELDAMCNIAQRNYSRQMIPQQPQPLMSLNLKLGFQSQQTKFPKPILKSKQTITDTNTGNLQKQQQKIDPSVKNELESILRKQAITAEDQYKILDARDKLIRLTTIRTTDIKKVERTKGTCPDMCPEKERLLRETRNQVASFEVDETMCSIMNYKLAIKEYSRSSADQETPLAHELRPETVLKMTMNYLMHRIMGLCDDLDTNIGDWYHFVWDRTRSIRKDITQQELCSLGSVELLEQCARFHIHCAARLIGEDSSVFDHRINTENLTKCLQTLKYMYHDLRLKNIKCPKEAEFRAYIILLNLQDSNFLWEIKQLPEELQKSEEIQMAVSFYLAKESNNYVNFFNLIRKTTYMNGCILLRYFSQIRYKSLQIMIKSLSRSSVPLSLQFLKKILAFESIEETVSFLNHCGLECDAVKVKFGPLEKQEDQFFMDRSLELIESKLSVNVGEAICGKPLESITPYENYEPHCSFDENGYLLPEAWTAEDQLLGKQGQSKQKLIAKSFDDNIFKMPISSPPISPKQHLMKSSIFSQSLKGSSLQTKTNKSGFQQTDNSNLLQPTISNDQILKNNRDDFDSHSLEKLQKTPPISTSIFGNTDSTFSKPIFGNLDPPPSKLIFGNPDTQSVKSLFGNTDISKPISENQRGNIFTTNLNQPKPLHSDSDNIFKTNIFSTQKPDNVFQHFNEARTLPIPKSGSELTKSIFGSEASKNNQQKSFMTFENEDIQKRETEEKLLQEQREEIERKEKKLLEAAKRMETERLIEEEKIEVLLAQKHEQINKISNEISNKISNEIINENCYELATYELKKYSKILINSEFLTDNLLDQVISEIILNISIDEFIHIKNQEILKKYFTLWKLGANKKRQRRKLIQETPIWIGGENLNETALQLTHSAQNQSLQLMKRYRLGIPKNFQLTFQSESQKINVFSVILNELQNFDCKNLHGGLLKIQKYFKFIISLPQEYEEIPGFYSYYSTFMENCIERENSIERKGFLNESKNNISICLRKISGIVPMNEDNKKVSKECNHATGLIFVMTTANDFNSQYKRLHHLLKLSEINKKIPVALICYKSPNEDDIYGNSIEYCLEIDELVEDEKISCLKLIKTDEKHLSESFENGIRFVARNSSTESDNLEMQNLVTFLQLNLVDGIWQRFNASWSRNTSFRQFCFEPQNIINLYNETINRLINLVEEDYQDYPEFPDELKEFVPKSMLDIPQDLEYFPNDWKNYNKRNLKISNFLKKLKLKNLNNKFPDEIEAVEKEILNYCKLNVTNCEKTYRLAGYSAIKVLLEQLNKPDLLHLSVSERLKHISWLRVFQPITLHFLIYFWKLEENNIPMEIIYRVNLLEKFNSTAWWLENEKVKEIKFQPEIEKSTNNIAEDDLNEIENDGNCIDLEPILRKGWQLIDKADRNIDKYKNEAEKSREISKNLDLSLYEYDYKSKLKKCHPRDDDLNTSEGYLLKSPNIKKSKMCKIDENCNDEYGDVIANAFAVIEKVEKRIDFRNKVELKFNRRIENIID